MNSDRGMVVFGLVALALLLLIKFALDAQAPRYELRLIIEADMPTSLDERGGKLYISQRDGLILVVTPQGATEEFLDLRDTVLYRHEQGLHRVLLDPDSRNAYVHYTGRAGQTVVERYTLSSPYRANRNSAEVVLQLEQSSDVHLGGDMHWGPNGYLYIALGDGGRRQRAADPSNLYGSILRIDVSELPYTIPADNPFDTEVWVYGLRNPWRFSFSPDGNHLWISDVGDENWEEINRIDHTGGHDLGWPCWEGQHRIDVCSGEVTLPIYEYSQERDALMKTQRHCAIIGGFVWQGGYVHGDWCSGHIWSLRPSADGWEREQLLRIKTQINAFGMGTSGLYVLTPGAVWRMEAVR